MILAFKCTEKLRLCHNQHDLNKVVMVKCLVDVPMSQLCWTWAVVMDMIASCIKVMQWGMIDGTSPLNNNIQFYSPLKSPFLEIFMLLGKTWSAQPSLWHLLRSIIIQHQGTISRAPAKLTPSDSGCESDSSVKMNVHTFIQTKYKTYQCFQSLQ